MRAMTFAESFRAAHGFKNPNRGSMESDLADLVEHGSTPPKPFVLKVFTPSGAQERVREFWGIAALYRALRSDHGFDRTNAREFIDHAYRQSPNRFAITHNPGWNYALEID